MAENEWCSVVRAQTDSHADPYHRESQFNVPERDPVLQRENRR
jgi:hypothetical protein